MIVDKIIAEVDKIIKTLTVNPISDRAHPDCGVNECDLSDDERRHSVGLMRINHCGEICAQGLYQGQALTSREKSNKEAFEKAAFEETEHLAWTKQRIIELGGKTSYLNPLYYFASIGLGIAAGLIGDKWNLGFLEETELQVEKHLTEHLDLFPPKDEKSLAIIRQMKIDEHKHAEMAHDNGAAKLPMPIKKIMHISSSLMTKSTYYI